MKWNQEKYKKAQQIIEHQFDLELLLKNREIRLIEQEISRGQRTLEFLNHILPVDNGSTDGNQDSIEQKENGYFVDNDISPITSNSCGVEKLVEKPSRVGVYADRDDGVLVKLHCPECKKFDFNNRVGFINHCRVSHQIRFNGVEDCIRRCGIPIDEKDKNSGDFDEKNEDKSTCFNKRTVSGLKKLDEVKNPKIKVFDSDELEMDDHTLLSGRTRKTSKDSAGSMSSDIMSDTPSDGAACPKIVKPEYILPPKHLRGNLSQNPVESRYFLKRRIIVGNVSKFIPMNKRTVDPRVSYRWMVYLRSSSLISNAEMDNKELGSFIRKVTFFLHDSFKPNHVIEVLSPPFRTVQYGWGEFSVRVLIEFFDEHLNKPLELIHSLGFDQNATGQQIQGPERLFEIELDRKTQFVLSNRTSKVQNSKQIPQDPNLLLSNQSSLSSDSSSSDKKKNAALENSETASSDNIENIPKSKTTNCRYCGYQLVAESVDGADIHCPSRCQFRPVTKKGKTRNRVTTLTHHLNLLAEIRDAKDSKFSNIDDSNVEEIFNSHNVNIDRHVEKCLESFGIVPEPTCSQTGNLKPEKSVDFRIDEALKDPKFNWPLCFLSKTASPDLSKASPKALFIICMATQGFCRDLLRRSTKIVCEEIECEKEDDYVAQHLHKKKKQGKPDQNPDLGTSKSNDLKSTKEESKPTQLKKEESQSNSTKKSDLSAPFRLLEGETLEDHNIKKKLMTPYHVFRAIFLERLGKLDFLSNTYMEIENRANNSKPNASLVKSAEEVKDEISSTKP